MRSVLTGLVLAGVGATVAMAGAVATAYADGLTDQRNPAASRVRAMTSLQHDRTISYPLDQVWPATLRYLRVDRGYTLVDRDSEAGYILFDVPLTRPGDTEARVARGSIEMFSTEDMSGRPSVRVQVSTDAGPSHLPHAIAEGLAQKLRRERGNPAPPPSPPTPPTLTPDPGAPPIVDGPIQP